MGTPLTLCSSMRRRAVPTVASGGSVTGSVGGGDVQGLEGGGGSGRNSQGPRWETRTTRARRRRTVTGSRRGEVRHGSPSCAGRVAGVVQPLLPRHRGRPGVFLPLDVPF